jgi:hypothetical protein
VREVEQVQLGDARSDYPQTTASKWDMFCWAACNIPDSPPWRLAVACGAHATVPVSALATSGVKPCWPLGADA